jgi:CheY-like chemotaxis protein
MEVSSQEVSIPKIFIKFSTLPSTGMPADADCGPTVGGSGCFWTIKIYEFRCQKALWAQGFCYQRQNIYILLERNSRGGVHGRSKDIRGPSTLFGITLAVGYAMMAGPYQILIVSENLENQEALKKLFIRLECRVKIAASAESGIEEIKKSRYSAIFADLCVRENGGRSVARWVKSESMDSKVFIVTSWKGELEAHVLQADGISDVIRKPFNFNEIKDKLMEQLGSIG